MRALLVRFWALVLALVVLGLMARKAGGGPLVIDGHPGDWGIAPGPYHASDWVPDAGIFHTVEDYEPGSADGYVGPGWGGQLFDAEALYFTHDLDYAYFGVVTGFPPEGASGHVPGDIAIDFEHNAVGWDYGIETTGSHGMTVGGLYMDITWGSGPWGDVSDPTDMICGAAIWAPLSTSLAYAAIGDGHYFIESRVPLSAFPLGPEEPTDIRAHWTMSSGSDAVRLRAHLPPAPPPAPALAIPEPATCTLLGSGLLAALALRVRRARKGKAPDPS
jgi:hypothetical protein